jgi:hypothetical protein
LTAQRRGVGMAGRPLSEAPDGVLLHPRNLAGVANQPALKVPRPHLGVKLHGQRGAQRKRLRGAVRRGGETQRPARQIERIAVPVEYGYSVSANPTQHALLTGFSQGEVEEAGVADGRGNFQGFIPPFLTKD